jgi:hypothetical protein
MLRVMVVVSLFGVPELAADESQQASESINAGVSVTLTVRCKEQYGPEVHISLKNLSESVMEFPAQNLPWSGSLGNISFESPDPDLEIVNWVGGHNSKKIALGQGESVSGVAPLWDRVEPPFVRGVRTLVWKYGNLHNGHLQVDFTTCPVMWRPRQNPRRDS